MKRRRPSSWPLKLAHMLPPQNHDDPPSARRVRGWLAHFCLPPGVYALTLHEVLYDRVRLSKGGGPGDDITTR